MEKAKKWLFKILLIILLVFSYRYFTDNYYYKKQVVENKITISQSVVLDEKKSEFITYQANDGTTALDLLRGNFKIVTKGDGVNAYVTTINNREALSDNKEYWAFYINGKPSSVGAGSYILKQGDKIEWKIATY